ncbi:Metallo-dependent phosphatase [Serendipita vermifera]|nr:Metallo-dependent phosphatase [Serendipita vermifera]
MATRARSSSIPSLADAQYAIDSARRQPARRIASYTVVVAFITVFLILGFGSGYSKDWENIELGLSKDFPNFERIPGDGIRTISEEEIREARPKRFIVVGDIHGMHGSFKKILSSVSYSESSDYLIHVGDLVAKGPSSPQVLNTMSHANVTGVRGNHDQKVIEWKAWIEWVQSHKGGRAWLRDMESKTEEELDDLKRKTNKHKWKIPDGWKFGGEHYWIARNLKPHEEKYMNNLPLILHLPGYHLFFVHAGLLPLNPTIPLNSRHQPLSHVPGSVGRNGKRSHYKGHGRRTEDESESNESSETSDDNSSLHEKRHRKPTNKKELRMLQEQLLLSRIPQNTIPFNLLNMRSVQKNKPVKSAKGRPWSEVWNTVVSKCKGFPDNAVRAALTGEPMPVEDEDGNKRKLEWWEKLVSSPGEVIDWSPDVDQEERIRSHVPEKLPCNPSTVIYGHAAGRGLDVKRWTMGLDSGCVYGRRMTALVFSESADHLTELDAMNDLHSREEGEEDDSDVEILVKKVELGDVLESGGRLHGRLVSVKCPDVGA